MKRGHQHPILPGHDRLAAVLGQHLDPVELDRLAYLDRLDAAFLERPGVKREVALEGEHTDPHTGLASPAARATTRASARDPSPRASRSRYRPWPRPDPRSHARARRDPGNSWWPAAR